MKTSRASTEESARRAKKAKFANVLSDTAEYTVKVPTDD